MALDTVGGVQYLYVSEHGDVPQGSTIPPNGGQILKINVSTGTTQVIATRGTGDGQFISPDAIVVDPATHNLFIADRWLNRVQQITNTGAFVMKWGTGTVGGTNEMHGPVGLARDNSGAIYVSEHGDTNGTGIAGNMVAKYTISGSTATQVWRKGNGLNVPYSVTANGSLLYVSDGFNHQVQVWDLNGIPQGSFPTGAIALGASFDSAGNMWIAESGGDNVSPQSIVKRNPTNGAPLQTFGSYGTGNGQFNLVFDVAVDSASNKAYVTDYHNNRVQVIDLAAASGGSVPTINSNSTAAGTVGQSFTYQVTATNGPISSYQATDALPAGLSLGSATGVISGVPTAAATVTTHLTATNASGTSAPFALTFNIAAASGGGTPGTPALPIGPSVTSIGVTAFTRGVGGEFTVVFDSNVTGVDQTDFAMNSQGASNAAISGAVVPVDARTYKVPFTYQDNDGHLQLAIKTSGTGITDASGNAFRGAGVTASPNYGTGPTFGSQTLNPASATVTAGTPSGNNVTFTVTYSSAVTGVDASDFIITGTSATINAPTGSGTTWQVPVVASGTGTVTLTPIGGATANIKDATNTLFAGANGASATIAGSGGGGTAPTIANQTAAAGTVGTPYSYQISASGATSFSVQGTPALPAGLSLNGTTGVVSGTPSAAGTTVVTVQATNANGSNTAQVTFNIAAASGGGGGTAPTISAQTAAAGTVGTAYTYQVVASGATSYAVTGSTPLPAGLSLNGTTGVVSGTPSAAGTAVVTIQATNANGSNSAPVTFNIAAASGGGGGTAPTISAQTAAAGTVGTAYTYQVVASGATSYSVSGTPALPAGLSLNGTTGVVSGTPTTAGTTIVNIKATNATGSNTAAVTFNIAAASSGGGGSAPVVPTQTAAAGTVGTSYTYQISASGATSFAVSGTPALPAGLSLNATTGVVSGTPTVGGTTVVNIQATNANGSTTGAVTFNIGGGSSGGSGGGGGGGGGVVIIPPPPTPAPKAQTITFNTPVSAIIINKPITLSATSDSGLPVTFSIVSGTAVLNGNALMMTNAGPVVVRASQAGNGTWAAATADTTFTAQKAAQSITLGSNPVKAYTDGNVSLAATSSSGLPITYTVVSGPATISGNTLTFTGSGAVVIRAAQAGNDTYANTDTTFTITGGATPRLINISSRVRVSSNDSNGASIAGFVVTGNSPKQILIRAVGPTLSTFGVSSPLANPTLKLFDSKGTMVASNTGWSNDAKISTAGDGVGAFKLTQGSADSALLVTLQPGAYTAQVQSTTNSGTVLIEVYDVTANSAVPTKQLINISTRGTVGSGDDVLVGGFVVSGSDPKKVLVRAIGPGLGAYGVTGTLTDPVLKLYNSRNVVIAQNDNWATGIKVASETPATAAEITAANSATGAFPLTTGSSDSAIIMTLDPGAYTAIVTSASGGTGAALIEVYEIPNP